MIPATLRCSALHRICCLVAILLCASQYAGAKELRGDVVIMKNGDRFTGEVKALQSGVLYVDTKYVSSNIGLDWTQVREVQSKAMYLITLASGTHVTGRIERAPAGQEATEDVTIHTEGRDIRVQSENIVEIATQKSSIWRQLTGSLDAGVSYTSGNSQATATTNAIATYTTPKWSATGSLGTSFSNQSGGTKTNRNDAAFSGQRFFSRNSYLGGLVDLLHSSQQDLDLRTTAGGGYGRYWKRTGNTSLRWLGGVVYTKENFTTTVTSPSDSNAEGLFGVDYDSFRFKVGEVHVQVLVFPGLSDYGRIRTTTNNSLTIKLTNNFHFTLSFWDNYDSRPPAPAKNNELGLSSGIGWSF
jgi:putative salt-induced outer membrane protein YdiY